MSRNIITTDVILIGAGPIGLEMAVALKQRGLDYIHLEKGQIGQTISWFPPQTHFFSSNDRIAIAGVPIQNTDQSKATREQYLAYLRTVVLTFDLDVRTYEPVVAIERDAQRFIVRTQPAGGEQVYHANRVILAVGDMARPRELGIPGEDLPHVSHYFEDPHKYFRRKVLIVGGKNSAVEAALRCYHTGVDVTLSYRRDEFDPTHVKYWLLPELKGRIKRDEIHCHLHTIPTAISPTHVTLAPVNGMGEPFDVPADFVLLLTGYVFDPTLYRMAGVDLRGPQDRPSFDNHTMQTNIPGLYVAGTATAGTQREYRVFIENCHVHVDRILASLTGEEAAPDQVAAPEIDLPES